MIICIIPSDVLSTLTMSLCQIITCCSKFPQALSSISFDKLVLYLSLICHLKSRINFTHSSTSTGAPLGLPMAIHQFLQHAVGIDDYDTHVCWTCVRDIAWSDDPAIPVDLSTLIPMFLAHGFPSKLGMLLSILFVYVSPHEHLEVHELLPPTHTCIVANCPNHLLQHSSPPDLCETISHEAVLFTRSHGTLPIYTTSAYCRGKSQQGYLTAMTNELIPASLACSTQYYHDCYVRNNIRTYYTENILLQFDVIQISTHFFIKSDLCTRFRMQMALAWYVSPVLNMHRPDDIAIRTSAQNCAHIYNQEAQTCPWRSELPVNWPITYDLNSEAVSKTFIIHALLKWHGDHGTQLQVSHKAPNQAAQWHNAVHTRNLEIAGTSQPEWNHACNQCTHHIRDEIGGIVGAYRSVFTDGISLGHPCCAIHDCKEPLVNSKHHFCPLHMAWADRCVVWGCLASAETPFHTCTDPAHRDAEQRYTKRGKAMFQLKQRLAKNFSPTVNSLSVSYTQATTPEMAIQGYIIHVHIVHSSCDLYFMREVNVLHPSLHITVILN